ncbi:kielin/chordin-like protein [Xenopus tropicalis]|uniref:Kielin/chordin-like protein n=1 Tax=Xenopus tropicalis TaxID=8364 RepID=A0A8J1JJH0_XENTR|nr:kielin/chordin-like protein [Xenopus tropicalis]
MKKDKQLKREQLLAGDEILRSHSRERDGKCYSYICDGSCRNPTRVEQPCEPTPPPSPPTPPTPPTTTSCACHHEGRMYIPGDEILRSHSGERDGKCYSYICDVSCKQPTRIEQPCGPTPPPPTPPTPPTTTSCACHHEGRMFIPGDEILRSHSRERDGKCYSYICDGSCRNPTRVEQPCEPTPPPSPPTPPTPPTTTSCACHHEGRMYIPGDEILRSHSGERDGKCYSYICDVSCKQPTRIEQPCGPTPPPPTPPTPPTTTSCACHHEGRMFIPGDEILRSHSRERDGKCYSYICDGSCRNPTRVEQPCEPTPPPSPPTPPTPPTTTSCACHHEGRMYIPGDEILRSHSRERDGKCYSYVCDISCKQPTRIEQPCGPTPPPPTPPTPPTTTSCACHHEGRMYIPGQEIVRSDSREKDGKCYSYVCDGTCKKTTRIEKPCIHTPPTPPPKTPPTVTVTECACHHEGRVYMPGKSHLT